MPVYAFRCDHCGVQFDRYRKVADEPFEVCPECGEHALRKLFQPVGIVFKGSGFYSTDNRSSSGASKEKADKDEKAEKKSENSKETKSEATTKPDPAQKK